ncbi:transglutaminase-like cysteine peptidase [Aurantimonas sp. VKM B-3413]|nr:transglutaminase-like cysteine peptidase [Aurantimonas sp. VKM B-3413]MCB8840146.1 transglutaminase-like cysteine peptidase [Aurantimonas sp. VKM B-3413]
MATSANARGSAMLTAGITSQPVGHYEFCKRYPGTCRPSGAAALVKLSRTVWSKMLDVNNAVNRSIMPRTDQDIYGIPEYWAYPTVEGDCEDFALLKQYMLEQQGIPASALLITVVRQTNGEGHAVLTVRTDQGDFILDNLDNRVLAWDATDYQYLKRQSERDPGKWATITDDRNLLVGSVR